MKRIKKVFSSSYDTLERFAQQTQDYGRQGGRIARVFFEGTSAFSYGSHYELARIVEYNGIKIGIVNTRGYSNTTSKHIGGAFSALKSVGMLVLGSKINFDVYTALLEEQGRLVEQVFNNFSRRSFWKGYKYWDAYGRREYTEFNALCRTLGHTELVLNVPKDLIQEVKTHIKARLIRQEELEREKNKAKYFNQDVKLLLDGTIADGIVDVSK